MNRTLRHLILLLCAAAAGWGASEVLLRSAWSRDVIGLILGRGRFVTVVRGEAIHERDISRENDANAETMVVAAALRHSSGLGEIESEDVARELDLLRSQFGDEARFTNALEASGMTEAWLRALLADHLEVRRYLETSIAPNLGVTDEECREVYEAKQPRFVLPPRFRASHIFVAAPDGSADDLMLAKRSLAQGLSIRLLAGEDFAAVAAEASEDEETKFNSGDLKYFSARRSLPDLNPEVEKLAVDQTSSPLRSRLGFHIIRLTEILPERALSFEEVRDGIATQLANEKRAAAVAALRERLTPAGRAFPTGTRR